MEEKKKELKQYKQYELIEVPTQYGLAISRPAGEAMTTEQAIVEILNKLERIEKAVA